MPMMKTSSKQVISGNNYSSSLSLCLSCTLAYGYLCFAVPFADRDWIMAYEERVYAGSHAPYTICSVVKCRRYQYSANQRTPLAPIPSRWERPLRLYRASANPFYNLPNWHGKANNRHTKSQVHKKCCIINNNLIYGDISYESDKK